MDKEKQLAYAEIGQRLWENRANPQVRMEMATKITQEIRDRVELTDATPLFFDVQTTDLGTDIEFSELKHQIRAYYVEPDGYTPRSSLFKRVYTPTYKNIGVNPSMNLLDMESGRYGSMDDFINGAVDAIKMKQNEYVFATMQAAVGSGAINYATCSNVTTFKTALDNALDYIDDRGGVRAVLGRRSILRNVTRFKSEGTFRTFPESTLEEIMRRGVISLYNGAPLVGLERQVDSYNVPVVPADEVWVIGNSIGKFIYQLDLKQMEYINAETWRWGINMIRRVGCVVIYPQNIYRIKLT